MLIQATTNVAQLIIRTCVLEYLTHFDPGLMMVDDYGYGDDEAAGASGEAGAGQGLQISSKLGSSYMCYTVIWHYLCVDTSPDGTAGGASFSQRVREMSADSFLSCLVALNEYISFYFGWFICSSSVGDVLRALAAVFVEGGVVSSVRRVELIATVGLASDGEERRETEFQSKGE